MKKIFLFNLTLFITLSLSAQDIVGKWNGQLNIQGSKINCIFKISKTDSGYKSTMDVIEQGAKDIPASNTSFKNEVLKININLANIEYEGKLGKEGNIIGNFKQNGYSFPMNLSRNEIKNEKNNRPQEPQKPYSYYTEDVIFENKIEGIKLAGTLTLPNKTGVFPAVILITGSGPQNRDEEIMGHKPFLVLSDFLTKNGIAVIRFDDRGTNLSTGNFATATTANFATDVESAIEYLKTRNEINKNKIGLIGHSEGGLIAQMVASKYKDIAFIVLLASPGIEGDKTLILQANYINKMSGQSDVLIQKKANINSNMYEIVKNSNDIIQLKTDLTAYLKENIKDKDIFLIPQNMKEDDFINKTVNQIATPWFVYFIKFNPAIYLENVKCPILAINGEKDVQVLPKENLAGIKQALTKGGNENIKIMELPNLNHLFQECKTGLPNEYGQIEQTFSPIAMELILQWIQSQTK